MRFKHHTTGQVVTVSGDREVARFQADERYRITEEATVPNGTPDESWTVAALLAYADNLGIEVPRSGAKAKILEALTPKVHKLADVAEEFGVDLEDDEEPDLI